MKLEFFSTDFRKIHK